ncbi:MAG: hypothetical protein AAFX03_10080 [Pseudomonadota bacterium]
MSQQVSFRGARGRAIAFNRVDKDGAWAREPGVAVFAASDSYGWRVIRVVEVTGRVHDVRPFCALADAERFGAEAVFFAGETAAAARKAIVGDLEAGLNPVCAGDADYALAA